MKLYDEGKIDLNKKLGDYLPWVKGSNKEKLIIKNILLHEAGLAPIIWFYKEQLMLTETHILNIIPLLNQIHLISRVAQNLFLRTRLERYYV